MVRDQRVTRLHRSATSAVVLRAAMAVAFIVGGGGSRGW